MMRMKEKKTNPYFKDPTISEYSPMFTDTFIERLAQIFLED